MNPEIDKRKKPKIPVKTLPEPVVWILSNATGEQLDYLNKMGKSGDFKIFVNLINKFKEFNVYKVFGFESPDDRGLTIFRAFKRGEIQGLDALIFAAQAAGIEIERRKKMKIL